MMRKITKNIIMVAVATGLILLVPLVAMQFSDEVDWDLTDFIAAGILLFGSGLVYVLAASRIHSIKYRVAIGFVIAAVLLLVWAELAVGLFGSPWAGS